MSDAFVGVCCTSVKKICGILNKQILDDGESLEIVRSNTVYDARVQPLYILNPQNVRACANITRRTGTHSPI